MCLGSGQAHLRQETAIAGRTIAWAFYPILAGQVVHCYASDITNRLNPETQLLQAQKMESVGQLAAGVAHDFNNILAIIQGHSGLMQETAGLSGPADESLKQITLAADRAANLTRQLLMFSRKQLVQPRLLDLNESISSVAKMLRVLVGETVNLRLALASKLPVIYADPGMIHHQGNGQGHRPRAGDGLWHCQTAHRLAGSFQRGGQGKTFRIFLPVSSKSVQPAPGELGPHDVRGGTETILLVEDEMALRELVIEVLQRYGHKILEAASGVQALAVWSEHKGRIDLVLTDMMMPEGVSGGELAARILAEIRA